MVKSREYGLQKDSVQSQNSYLQTKVVKNFGINVSVDRRLNSLPDLDLNVVIYMKYIYKILELVLLYVDMSELIKCFPDCRFMRKGVGEVK